MRSQLIDLFRFGIPATGILRRGDRYILVKGNEPAIEVCLSVDHVDFMELLDRLRYGSQTGETERRDALNELANAVTAMLGSITQPSDALQIDLVTSAAELAALPFELAVDATGKPIFAASEPPLILTRRLRGGSDGERPAWWSVPRVLFAAASPPGAGDPVPLDANLDALRAALKPWIQPLEGFPEAVPDERSVLTVLRNASPEAIQLVGQEAVDQGRPFTHLHIVAHGCAIGRLSRQRFAIAMHDSDDPAKMVAVGPEMLSDLLMPIAEHLAVATLAACDGGDQANSIAGGGSMAHELRRSGIPVAVASHFPLTFDGSITFTSVFYQSLLAGDDVRIALHKTLSTLYQKYAHVGHDWGSPIAYMELPSGYADRLHKSRQEAQKRGHVFISYVREDSETVDRLQRDLEAAGIIVWRDLSNLSPGDRWKEKIRRAISSGSFFLCCFSEASMGRDKSYMNEELFLAVEELRVRSRTRSWFIPVVLPGGKIQDWPIGGGENLTDFNYLSLSPGAWQPAVSKLVKAIKQN